MFVIVMEAIRRWIHKAVEEGMFSRGFKVAGKGKLSVVACYLFYVDDTLILL